MRIKNKWIDGNSNDMNCLTLRERKVVDRKIKNFELDMAQGSFGSVRDQKVKWFRTVFDCPDIMQDSKCSYLLFDFGYMHYLREVEFYLNGTLIGSNINSCVETKYLVPSELINKSDNSLIALIIKDDTLYIWPDMNGLEKIKPGEKQKLKDMLPGNIDIMDTNTAGRIMSIDNTEYGLGIMLSSGLNVRIIMWQDNIIRITYENDCEQILNPLADDICLEGLKQNLNPCRQYNVVEKEEKYSVHCNGITVDLYKDSFGIRVYDKNKKPFFNSTEILSDGVAGLNIELMEQEHIFGLGENSTPTMDKRGRREYIWVSHDFVKCDIPVPFYISTGGYGLYLNNSYHSVFDMGNLYKDKALVWAMGGKLDYFIIYGPDPKKIVSSFTAITGRPKLPPGWAFGYWQSITARKTQYELINRMEKFKEEEIPVDVLHIDPHWLDKVTDIKWSKKRYPDPKRLLKYLKENNIRLSLWTSPFVNSNSCHYNECSQKGYLLKDENGNSLKTYWWMGIDSGIIDFTNPDAVRWRRDILKPLIDIGVDVFKIDGGDGYELPSNSKNADGRQGHEFHNLYPLYFARVTYDILQKERPDERVIVWARTGFTGSGRYPCTWGGDQFADFSGTRVLIKAGQAAGLAGIPFWSPDVGGFARCKGTTEEFYIRSFQWGLLAPLSRAHGSDNEPWSFGKRAQVIIKKFIKLRYRLLPYIYSYAHYAARTGIPVMRAMFLEYPCDKESYVNDYQYFLGDYLMVAPVYEESKSNDLTSIRDIYLPEGEWTDFWTGETLEGGESIKYKADITIIPLFVRSGAILPMWPLCGNIAEFNEDELQLHIYPSEEETGFTLYNDDGISLSYCDGEYQTIDVTTQYKDNTVNVIIEPASGKFTGMKESIRITLIIHGLRGLESAVIYSLKPSGARTCTKKIEYKKSEEQSNYCVQAVTEFTYYKANGARICLEKKPM